MKHKIINGVLVIACIFTLAAVIHSCKKTDNKANDLRENKNEILRQTLIDNPEMKQIIMPINEKVQGHWEDGNGSIITSPRVINNNADRVYECASAADVTYPPGASIVSIGQDYDCNQGYKFTFTYNISISVNLLNSFNCSGTLNTSKARVRVRNIQGVFTYTDLSLIPSSIINIGDDLSTGNSNVIFKVVFTSQWIPFSNFTASSSAVILSSVVMATDCCLLPIFATAYSQGNVTPNTSNPCTRIDPIAITNATLPGTTFAQKAVINGFGNIIFTNGCPAPPTGTYPDRQEIQILYTGSTPTGGPAAVWKTIQPQLGTYNVSPYGNLNPFVLSTQAGTIGIYNTYYVPDRDLYFYPTITTTYHGLFYKIRYRNKMSNGCVGPWSAEKVALL